MKNIIDIGKIIDDVNIYENFLLDLKNLKTVTQKYYEKMIIPSYPCWLQYVNERNQIGSISITSSLYKHKNLKNLTSIIAQKLNNLKIFKNIKFKNTRINFLRTSGTVAIHQDTGERNCAINIGLKNSNLASTKISLDNVFENFDKNHETLIMNNGYGYLINTQTFHSVYHHDDQLRYLITYSFKESFEEIKNKIII